VNSDTTVCPITRTLVEFEKDEFGRDVPIKADMRAIISIDNNGFVSINESNYDGTEVKARVKGITPFNVAVYKDIVITNRCALQVTTVNNDPDTGTNGESVIIIKRSE